MDKKKVITAIIGTVLVIALVLGWSLWRQSVTRKNEDANGKPNTSQTPGTSKKKAKKTLTADENKQNRETAIQFELAARNWGVDSTISASEFSKKSADEVLAALRTPDLGESPIKDMISFQPDENAGANAASYVCTNDDYQAFCQFMPTAQVWWKNEAWGTGTRWLDTPKAKTLNDGSVEITGKVRTILVTRGDTYSSDGYNALTPAWRDFEINDILTIKNGKVSSIRYERGINYWWINPWLNQWKPDNVADIIGGGERVAIPVSGTLNWTGMNPTSITRVLKSPNGMGDLDGTVDWSLWDDLIQAGGSDSTQQAPDLDPEKDAATLHERE